MGTAGFVAVVLLATSAVGGEAEFVPDGGAAASEGVAPAVLDAGAASGGDAGRLLAPALPLTPLASEGAADGGVDPGGGGPVTPADAGPPDAVHYGALLTGMLRSVPYSVEAADVVALRVDASTEGPARTWARATLAVESAEPLLATQSVFQGTNRQLQDTGTSLTLGFSRPESSTGELSVTAYPFSSRRVQPTFEWRDTWGGPLEHQGQTPTIAAQWRGREFSAWVALRLGSRFYVSGHRLGGLAGASWVGTRGWSLELRGAALDRDENPLLWVRDISSRIVALGATARLGWRMGGGVDRAHTRATLRGDPERFERLRPSVEEVGRLAAQVFLDGGYATQDLLDPDDFLNTRAEPAGFVDLQVRLRVGRLRLFAEARLRTASLVLFDAPGFLSYQALSRSLAPSPALDASLGAELKVADWLVPGVTLWTARAASASDARASTTLAFLGPGHFDLYRGSPVPTWLAGTASARLELGRNVSILGRLDVSVNPQGEYVPGGPPDYEATLQVPYTVVTGALVLQVRLG